MPAHPQAREIRPLPILAELLEPFVGRSAQPAANVLLKHFGSIGRLMTASEAQLARVDAPFDNVGRVIIAARALVEVSLQEHIQRSPITSTDPAFRKYLILKLRHLAHEELHAFFIDATGDFIAEELISRGELQNVEMASVTVFRRALDLNAAGLILVHNHPSRCAEPSREDVTATGLLISSAAAIGLHILDHIIVGGNVATSMRERGLM